MRPFPGLGIIHFNFMLNFQVFVYEQSGYEAVKRRLREGGYSRSSYMAQLPYLLPLWVKHMGKVMVLNSSPQATASIREALTIRFLFSSYPNIFKVLYFCVSALTLCLTLTRVSYASLRCTTMLPWSRKLKSI